MPNISIVQAVDKNGVQYFPITHMNGVIDNSGTTIGTIIDKISPIYRQISVNGNLTSQVSTIEGNANSGKCENVIYSNNGSEDYMVAITTNYTTPDGQPLELTCPVGGYCEVNYVNMGGTIYARGV